VAHKVGIEISVSSGPGILHQLTGVIADEKGNITSVEIVGMAPDHDKVYFEVEVPSDPARMIAGLRSLPVVRHAEQVDTMEKIYGKRIIIVGGGAQVGQVALGAITEADRHNIRGDHLSIDTIPSRRLRT
jgi:energy-converting hydrogenase B subunit Q